MFGKSLKRVFGKGHGGPAEPPASPELLACFAFLDRARPGYTARLVNFIETGADRAAVAEIEANADAIHKALKEHRLAEAQRKDPKRDYRHYIPQAASEAALPDAVLLSGGDPDRIVRLIEAGLAAQLMRQQSYFGYNVNGDLLTPGAYHVFQSVRIHRNKELPKDGRSSFADLLAASAALKVDHESLLASGFWHDWTRDGLGIYGFGWISSAPLEVFSRAMKQLNAEQREAMLQACLDAGVAPQGDVLPYWFTLTDDGSAKVRDVARRLIQASDDARQSEMAIAALSSGKAAQRAVMVQILGESGTEEAVAALKERQPQEKTRAVQLLIDQFLSAPAPQGADPDRPGFEAADGQWITPPEFALPADDGAKPFGAEDEAELRALEDAAYERDMRRWTETPPDQRYGGWTKPERHDDWQEVLAAANGDLGTFTYCPYYLTSWFEKAVPRMSPGRVLRLWARNADDDLYLYSHEPEARAVDELLEDGSIDARTLVAALEADYATGQPRRHRNHGKTRDQDTPLPEWIMSRALSGDGYSFLHLPDRAIWPMIADHLPMLAENLPPHELNFTQNMRAMALIEKLPALPKVLIAALVNASTAEARSVRRSAQALLAGVADVTPQIVDALSDSRQAVRANAASFLAQRGDDSVLTALEKQLKKEKADLARAALIAAIATLGGDSAAWLGQAALEREAADNAKKLKGDKIDWLAQETAPVLHWKDGTPVAGDLLDGWLKLAVKLKTLEDGAGLFRLYLDQLRPEDAAALGDWVLSSWIAFDTAKRAREDIYREQLEAAKITLSDPHNARMYGPLSAEALATRWTNMQTTEYPNSGAASKGILALTLDATPQTQARLASGYLKNHGKRVAQAKTMVELLALSGSPDALQVVVATATRFKQRTVRELAEQLVERVAEERGWTADELADRSIPSGGLEEGGVLDLPMGEDAKPYQARLDSGLVLHLHNPDGRPVKSLPAGSDENSKDSKALLTAAKKVLKEVVQKQSGRLYEAMLTGRDWSLEAWQTDLRGHPIVGRLCERAIWRGLDAEGQPLVTFRPTAEGDLMTAEGDDADLAGVERIDLVHATALTPEALAGWAEHLRDFEIIPLFSQIDRPVLTLPEGHADTDAIADRKGWMMDNLKLQSLAAKLGYDRGGADDGGSVMSYDKRIDGLDIRAEMGFSGTYFGAESHPVALTEMRFYRIGARRYRPLQLADLPPRLLSECWNDLHDVAKSGAFDPEWEKKGLW